MQEDEDTQTMLEALADINFTVDQKMISTVTQLMETK